jgi:hypothetical protein
MSGVCSHIMDFCRTSKQVANMESASECNVVLSSSPYKFPSATGRAFTQCCGWHVSHLMRPELMIMTSCCQAWLSDRVKAGPAACTQACPTSNPTLNHVHADTDDQPGQDQHRPVSLADRQVACWNTGI